jgi:hypothetical protein
MLEIRKLMSDTTFTEHLHAEFLPFTLWYVGRCYRSDKNSIMTASKADVKQ